MKRFFVIIMAFVMLVSLCACGDSESASQNEGDNKNTGKTENAAGKTLDLTAEADAIIEKYSLSGGLRFTSKSTVEGEFLDEDLAFDYFGEADFDTVVAYDVYIDTTKPVKPCEFGIFEMKDKSSAETFKKFLEARIAEAIETAKSYPSTDTEPLKTAKFTVKGKYVWYCAVKGGNDDINKTLEGKLS